MEGQESGFRPHVRQMRQTTTVSPSEQWRASTAIVVDDDAEDEESDSLPPIERMRMTTTIAPSEQHLGAELSTIKSIKYEARIWLVWSFLSVVLDLIDLVAETGIFDW